MSTLNWGDLVKDAGDVGGNYEPLPDGDYELQIIEATAKVAQSGKTMFAVKAQVTAGAHAKRLVWDNLVVTPDSPAALGMFFRKMTALGLGREFFASNPSNAQIEAALQNRSFRAQVGSRTWNGSKKNEIKMYYVATTGATGTTAAAAAAPAPAPAPAPAAAPAPAPAVAPAVAVDAPVAPPAPPAAPF
jgi:hypothetical protein